MEPITDQQLVDAAMQMIILAGDARKLVFDAGDALADSDFDAATTLLGQAQDKLRAAHTVHTDLIQVSASGSPFSYSMLFTHAEDTLMTANSEFRLVKKLITVFQRVDARLTALESHAAEEVAR